MNMASSPLARAASTKGGNGASAVSFAKEPMVRLRAATEDQGDSASRARSRSFGGGSAPPSNRRMSMPQQMRQSSMVLPPPGARSRATSAAAMGLDGEYGDPDGVDMDCGDQDDDHGHNLTFDGVKEGAYMLCKRSDDLLGHHARQVFREKAASMRGMNSIYYYLKDLMKKFGSDKIQKKGLTSAQIVLEAHEFRKLIASDPAFQSAIPEEQIDALFHRMEHEELKVVRHLDFVEFCLFDHHQLRLLLYKFRKQLRRMRLTDNEITDTFRRLTSTNGTNISSDLLHAAIARELDVVLTTGELRYLQQLMDLDGDGDVKVNDFEVFVKDDRASFDLIHPATENGIVDLKISTSEVEEANLKREVYTKLCPSLQEESNTKVHLWYKTAPREDGKSAITNIRYAPSSRDSELVSKGFTCLQQDVNRGGAFGKHKYIWLSYVPPTAQSGSEIIDMSLSSGELDDTKDAKLWLPMHRGFKLVSGDLNDKSSRNGVFLWIRRRPMHSAEDLVDATHESTVLPDSPRARSKVRMHADELEAYVRQSLRRNCPVDQDGAINFARLFDEFDQKKVRAIGKQVMQVGVESFGIKMKLKDFPLVWDRVNPCGKKTIDAAIFTQFLEMTDSEIDEIVNTLQRTMTTKSTQQQQLANYRVIFQSYNSLGDGRLSRADFQRLLATNQINFTNTELSKVIQRFDVNKDGVVDYADFLRFVTGNCDTAGRTAKRVADAAEELKTWAMEKQNKKLAKDGQIDSNASWRLLRPKRDVLDMAAIDHLLRERQIRFDTNKLRLLRVLIAPATNGEINQVAYHAFVNHQPRKISTMVYDMKKVAGLTPCDGEPDGVYDRLNVEGNGRLALVTFAKEINTLAAEKNAGVGPFDLKNFVYVAQWTGADSGGDGAILIDRFLAAVRDNNERRNMKHEFVTNYDSPSFMEGVKVLREEMRRCAKTPDGKFNYTVPFKLFDKDKSGQIVLSEFETAVRELGVDKYLTDQEIKSLMRRFDLNGSGGINYDEFLRFNLVESTSKGSGAMSHANIEPILHAVLIHERLTPATISTFCSSIKRMFSILDKDTHGVVSATQFAQTLGDMGVGIADDDMERLVDAFVSADDVNQDDVCYSAFCDALQRLCERSHNDGQGNSNAKLAEAPVEVLHMLCELFREYQSVRRSHAEMGKLAFDMYKAFGIVKGEKARAIFLQPDELKEVLWASGVHHPFLRDELESILRCFQWFDSGFNASAFCMFMDQGPTSLFGERNAPRGADTGILDGYITRLHEAIDTYMATGGRDAEERLHQCFSELDEDGSGALSQEEFVHVLHKAGLRRFLTPDDEHLLLQFLDANGDGVVSYKEFVEFAKHGEKKLNDVVDQQQQQQQQHANNGHMEPPSRSRPSASPPRSPASQRSRSPSPTMRSTSSTGHAKHGSPNARSSSPPSKLIHQVAKLNSKLHPHFPFEKYFEKYRLPSAHDAVVKCRVFEKIIDKFLARLVEHNIAYNMQELDADLLMRVYESPTTKHGSSTVIHYHAFLDDLSMAQSRAIAHGRWTTGSNSESSDDEHDGRDLSCSSDEGESKNKRATKMGHLLTEAIRRQYKAKPEYEALRTKLKTTTADLAKAKKDSKASENQVFKMLARVGLRLKKKEAEAVLTFVANSTNNGKSTEYDLKKLGVVINDQIGGLLGEVKKPETAATTTSASAGEKKGETGQSINAALSDKIYRSFIAAAQQNISGRRLLEKCDTHKTGVVSLIDLQTVLRLMGCVLTDSETNEIKGAFGTTDKLGTTINYRQLVRQLTKQLQQPPTDSATNKVQQQRPPPIQITPLPFSAAPARRNVDALAPQKAWTVHSSLQPPTRPLTADEMKRLDGILRPYFQDLLRTRRIDTPSLLRSFEPYDSKGAGFVSFDAIQSVLRKFDIWLADEMARNVLSRYAAASSGMVDYVDFSTTFGASSSSVKQESQGKDSTAKLDDGQRIGIGPAAAPTVGASTMKAPSTIAKADNATVWKLTESYESDQHTSSTTGWDCPVCLHTQTRSSSTTCEICAAQNPASVQYETLLKCMACDFRNRSTATHCDLCRLPLEADHAGPPSPQKSKSRKSMSLQIQIPGSSAPQSRVTTYNEKWLA